MAVLSTWKFLKIQVAVAAVEEETEKEAVAGIGVDQEIAEIVIPRTKEGIEDHQEAMLVIPENAGANVKVISFS